MGFLEFLRSAEFVIVDALEFSRPWATALDAIISSLRSARLLFQTSLKHRWRMVFCFSPWSALLFAACLSLGVELTKDKRCVNSVATRSDGTARLAHIWVAKTLDSACVPGQKCLKRPAGASVSFPRVEKGRRYTAATLASARRINSSSESVSARRLGSMPSASMAACARYGFRVLLRVLRR